MNGISNGWDNTIREETPYFPCGPSSQKKKIRGKGKREEKP